MGVDDDVITLGVWVSTMTGIKGRTRAAIGASMLALKRATDSAWLTRGRGLGFRIASLSLKL